MRPLPNHCFGPSGLPCVFTLDDDSGGTTVGYLVRQTGLRRFVVSDGSTNRTCKLAQSMDDVADPNNFPPATCTILVTLNDDSVEHIQSITATRCQTIEGTSIGWHTTEPTDTHGSITQPDLGGDALLLEDGGFWLLEDGSHWELDFS